MFRGTLYLSISQIVLVGTGVLLQIYLGRALGPEQYGIFSVINAFVMINELILIKSVYDTMSKFVAEKEEATHAIVRFMLKAMVITSFGLGGVYFLFSAQIASLMNDPGLAVYLKLVSFIIPFSAISAVFLGALNGLRKFAQQALIFTLYYVARIVVVIVIVSAGFSIKVVIIGLLASDILRLVMARLFYQPAGKEMDFQSRHMLGFALQLTIISVFSALVTYIDLLAVKTFIRKNFETGLYSSALTIAKIPPFMIVPISVTLLPTISKYISEGDEAFAGRKIIQALRLLMMIVLPVAMVIMGSSERCITFLFGDEYAQASDSLKILLLGGIFLSIKVLMSSVIIAIGHPRFVVFMGLFSLLTEVLFLVLLIDRMGLEGAAIASTITHFLGFLISYVYVTRRFMAKTFSWSFLRIIFASFIIYGMAAVYSPSGIFLLFYYAVLLCIFFSILVAVKEINLGAMKIICYEKWDEFRQKRIQE